MVLQGSGSLSDEIKLAAKKTINRTMKTVAV
jgi:hypothetical protein